jgi:membrane-associated phospholipid phosphatase
VRHSPPPTSQPSLWKQHWPEYSTTEGIFTVAAGVGTLALFLYGPVEKPRWQGGVLFDDAIRNGLRAESKESRQTFRTLGDLPYYAAPILPLVDTFVVSLAVRGDPKLARNIGLMSLEAFSYAGFASFLSTSISARERPDSSACVGEDCEIDTESFWSGHSSIVAASAGVVCANHIYMPLWGHPIADAAACVLATTGAAFTATTRVVADRHYTTDVIVGSGIGWLIGYGVPSVLHYSHAKLPNIAFGPSPGCSTCFGISGTLE